MNVFLQMHKSKPSVLPESSAFLGMFNLRGPTLSLVVDVAAGTLRAQQLAAFLCSALAEGAGGLARPSRRVL